MVRNSIYMYVYSQSRDYFRKNMSGFNIFFVYLSLAICWAQMRELVYSDVLYTHIYLYVFDMYHEHQSHHSMYFSLLSCFNVNSLLDTPQGKKRHTRSRRRKIKIK